MSTFAKPGEALHVLHVLSAAVLPQMREYTDLMWNTLLPDHVSY
jgi:hypothetical protein